MDREFATASIEKTCRYCERPLSECPDEFGHARLHGSSEWTWIDTARRDDPFWSAVSR